MAAFDRNKTYYKIIDKNLTHFTFRYKLGLNVDHIKFNPKNTCQPGGLYFTDADNINQFLSYGELSAEISIPEDAQIYQEPNKWKADKFIILSMTPVAEHPLFRDKIFGLEDVRKNGDLLQFIKNQTDEICLAAVRNTGRALQYVMNQTHEICLAAVHQNEFALRYVKDQTREICLVAVQKNEFILQYVTNQTDEICLAAVKRHGSALRNVKNQTKEICIAAIENNGFAFQHVKEKTTELYLLAIKQKPDAAQYLKNAVMNLLSRQDLQVASS